MIPLVVIVDGHRIDTVVEEDKDVQGAVQYAAYKALQNRSREWHITMRPPKEAVGYPSVIYHVRHNNVWVAGFANLQNAEDFVAAQKKL